MSPWLIALVGLIYAYIAGEQFTLGNWKLGIIYAGYAFSNIGLYCMTPQGPNT